MKNWRTRILIGLGIVILGLAVWIGVASYSENRARNSGWITYSQRNSGLISDNVFSIALDRDGNAWIGTFKGVSVFDGERWTTYSSQNSGLLGDEVRAIAMGSEGRVWFGTAVGANLLKGEQWIAYPATASSLPMSRYVTAIATDSAERVWFGTSGDGLRILDGPHWQILRKENSGLVGNYVNAVAIDPEGRIWVGTNEGLSVFDGTVLSSAPNLTSRMARKDIRTIAFDPYGNPWIGTRGQGAFHWEGDAWIPAGAQNPGGFSGDAVEAVAFDRQGRPYLLAENQLSILVEGEWVIYNSRNSGIAAHGNHDLTIGADGRIWFASGDGITVATPVDGGLPSRNVVPVEKEPPSTEQEEKNQSPETGFRKLPTCVSMALIALLPLVWLVVFLKDPGIPIAFLIAGIAWSVMSIVSIGEDYGAPLFISGGILIGGIAGGILGGILRKLTKKGVFLSLTATIFGCLAGGFFGWVFMAFWWMGF